MHNQVDDNRKREFDTELLNIAEYIENYKINSTLAYETARYCLMDTLGCGILALSYPECTKLLGDEVPGMSIKLGARVPGTNYELSPSVAAFNLGVMNRWLDFNDTWLAAEWGHPSDNLAAILALSDYLSRQNIAKAQKPLTMHDVLSAMIQAHEIQGVLALENSFNRVGLDHVILVKVASTAVSAKLLGANKTQLLNALSLAFVDGQSLRTYRHAPNTGSRKSWAAGDASSRGLRLSMMAMRGEMGYPSVLTAPTWGFYDVSFAGKNFSAGREYGSYVMENILFKISFPAEFHAQTAVECAVDLHPKIINRLDEIEEIILDTQESAVRIISKEGPLHNPADRDHCLQYMVAIGLLFGNLTADHYEDNVANDARIDALRSKMRVQENPAYTKDYLDPEKRSIANAIQVKFRDGSMTDKVEIEYPIGHVRRREEGIPVLENKFARNLATRFPSHQVDRIISICQDNNLTDMPVHEFINEWQIG